MSLSTLYKSKVYGIVVTYNGSRWVRQCIGSLVKSNYQINVIVVDNNSTDDTVEIIKKEFSQVDLIVSSENLGFGKANNMAISKSIEAGADFIFLLNQDAWVEVDTIEKLITALQDNSQFGIVSPLHYTGSGKNLDAGFRSYVQKKYSKKEIEAFIRQSDSGIKSVLFINAAAWLISRQCIEKVGGFNPLLFLYGEDNEYANRLQFHLLKLGFISNAKIYHDRENRNEFDSFKTLGKMTRYYQIKMTVRLLDVNQRLVQAFFSSLVWLGKETIFHTLWHARIFAPISFCQVFFYSLLRVTSVKEFRNKIKTRSLFLFLKSELGPEFGNQYIVQ